MRNSLRYIVVAIGDVDDPATEEDVADMLAILDQHPLVPLGLKFTPLSEQVSNKLTIALLEELRVL